MRKLFFVLFLVPITGFAQHAKWDESCLAGRPDSLGQLINMPNKTYYSLSH